MSLRRVPLDPSSPLRDAEDTTLVARLARGDEAALRELITRYGDRLCSYLQRIVGDGGWADDLVQETFVRVFDRASSYDPNWTVRVWLFGVARNLAVDLLRREGSQRSRLRDVPLPDEAPSTAAAVEQREFQDHLERAIETLPENYRSVFLLRESESLSYEEIGEVLGISVKTVSSRLHRSRVQLRERLEDYLER